MSMAIAIRRILASAPSITLPCRRAWRSRPGLTQIDKRLPAAAGTPHALKISDGLWTMPPFMGLTSWAAFQKGKSAEAMVMGDLVLMQDEVNPVMSELLGAGLHVTALHNHFFYDDPKVYFMHLGGEGLTEALAQGV